MLGKAGINQTKIQMSCFDLSDIICQIAKTISFISGFDRNLEWARPGGSRFRNIIGPYWVIIGLIRANGVSLV